MAERSCGNWETAIGNASELAELTGDGSYLPFYSYLFFEPMYMAATKATTENTKQRTTAIRLRWRCPEGAPLDTGRRKRETE